MISSNMSSCVMELTLRFRNNLLDLLPRRPVGRQTNLTKTEDPIFKNLPIQTVISGAQLFLFIICGFS